MIYEVKDEAAAIEMIAENIAWMYAFKKVDIEEVKAAIRDITLQIHIKNNFVQRVYLKYLEIVEKYSTNI